MKTPIVFFGYVVAALHLISTGKGTAQGTLSNLGGPSGGAVSVASDAWLAQRFNTWDVPSGYHLDSIQILLAPPLGLPQGLSVSVYDGANRAGGPGNLLGSLGGTGQGGAGVFTFTASGVTLAPLTSYWIVLKATTPVVVGSYRWTVASSTNTVSTLGWTMGNYFDVSANRSNWTRIDPYPLQFAVNATAIPEPSALALLSLGGVLGWWFRQRKAPR